MDKAPSWDELKSALEAEASPELKAWSGFCAGDADGGCGFGWWWLGAWRWICGFDWPTGLKDDAVRFSRIENKIMEGHPPHEVLVSEAELFLFQPWDSRIWD